MAEHDVRPVLNSVEQVEFAASLAVERPGLAAAVQVDTGMNRLGMEEGEAARVLGFAGMWAGLGPRIIMIGTLTAMQWFIYDGVKVALKLPRPPPPTMPESLKRKLEAEGKL